MNIFAFFKKKQPILVFEMRVSGKLLFTMTDDELRGQIKIHGGGFRQLVQPRFANQIVEFTAVEVVE